MEEVLVDPLTRLYVQTITGGGTSSTRFRVEFPPGAVGGPSYNGDDVEKENEDGGRGTTIEGGIVLVEDYTTH